MNKYKSLIVGSLMAIIIVGLPIISLADNSKEKVENKNSSSIWNRFNRFLGSNSNNSVSNERPSISGITAPTVLKTGEVGTWIINATDPQNGSLSYSVDWGDVKSDIFERMSASKTVFVQNALFTHSYANKGTYNITFVVSNENGQKATSRVTVHVTGAEINAPVISNLQALLVKPNKATIVWTTNTKSNSSLWLSKTSPVETTTTPNNFRKAKVLKHKIELSKLEPETKYYVVVGSSNENGKTISSEISFMTPAKDINNHNPVIMNLKGDTTVDVGENVEITVNAYDPENGTLSYEALWGDSSILAKSEMISDKPIYVQGATFNHVYNNPGTYTATFTVKDNEGRTASSSTKIQVGIVETDTTGPIITNLHTLNGVTTSTISWTTNEPSTSVVLFSKNTPVETGANIAKIIEDKSLVTKHSLNISELAPGTIYHFIIKSADANNNITVSSESAFMTNSGL